MIVDLVEVLLRYEVSLHVSVIVLRGNQRIFDSTSK